MGLESCQPPEIGWAWLCSGGPFVPLKRHLGKCAGTSRLGQFIAQEVPTSVELLGECLVLQLWYEQQPSMRCSYPASVSLFNVKTQRICGQAQNVHTACRAERALLLRVHPCGMSFVKNLLVLTGPR